MRIKRFFAKEMRFAIRNIREELGPDAVLLSSRKVEGGMEVVAAIDYDEEWLHEIPVEAEPPPEPGDGVPPVNGPGEDKRAPAARLLAPPPEAAASGSVPPPSLTAVGEELRSLRGLLESQLSGLAWGDFGRRHPLRAGLLRDLLELGLTRQLAGQLADEVPDGSEPRSAWQQVLANLADRLPVAGDDILGNGGVVALLGPTGVGKTTTIAKLAARFALGHGAHEVGLVTTDGYRIGAHEQLRTYAQLMGMPLRICRSGEELNRALGGFETRRLVLIDTAGMSPRDMRLSEQVALLGAGACAVKNYLVLSATTQYLGLDETVRAFHGVAFDGGIVTKVDESTSLGGVLSVLVQHGLPVAYVGNGQRVPEDIAPARAHRIVSKAVAIAQQAGRRCDDEAIELVFAGMAANAR